MPLSSARETGPLAAVDGDRQVQLRGAPTEVVGQEILHGLGCDAFVIRGWKVRGADVLVRQAKAAAARPPPVSRVLRRAPAESGDQQPDTGGRGGVDQHRNASARLRAHAGAAGPAGSATAGGGTCRYRNHRMPTRGPNPVWPNGRGWLTGLGVLARLPNPSWQASPRLSPFPESSHLRIAAIRRYNFWLGTEFGSGKPVACLVK